MRERMVLTPLWLSECSVNVASQLRDTLSPSYRAGNRKHCWQYAPRDESCNKVTLQVAICAAGGLLHIPRCTTKVVIVVASVRNANNDCRSCAARRKQTKMCKFAADDSQERVVASVCGTVCCGRH